jgi:hypothetical protein
MGGPMKKSAEKQIKGLFTKYSIPPLEVIIPVLQEAKRGEQELTNQVYNAYVNIAKGMRKIMGLKQNDMKTLAKIWEIAISFEGAKFQPVELTESKFSFSITDCPMLHVGKDISLEVKSKFCDLVCTGGSRALMDTILAPRKAVCAWNKKLIRGAGRCTVVFEFANAN